MVESACDAGDLGLIPGEGNGNSVFLPGRSHEQGTLAGYSPWGHEELDTTERLTLTLITAFYEDDTLEVESC